ncbi:MAG TPA: ATP-binding protein [Ktedonobacteraceae bacterium]|nr:ATP-binding protein [Ktedonobacteraceae bacterium]
MMEVEHQVICLHATEVFNAILQEFSAITDYRTLRDSLPRRLAHLFHCRCVLLYQRIGETLQFAAGSYDDQPGWSSSLLAVAHINPIDLKGNTLEAQAWRIRRAVTSPAHSMQPAMIAVPLIYRQRVIGVLVTIRNNTPETQPLMLDEIYQVRAPAYWTAGDVQVVETAANIIAMLLENARLLERERDRIRELSLLNSISSQMNGSMYDLSRLQAIVMQRTREISDADMCGLLLSSTPTDTLPWLSPTLQAMLWQHFSNQNDVNSAPFMLERPGDMESAGYLDQLPQAVKTFFAVPLLTREIGTRVSTLNRYGEAARFTSAPIETVGTSRIVQPVAPTAPRTKPILGMIVGAFQRPWKLRREELILLQVLANQAGAVLENIALVEAVIEARNEARKLLRQVLEDQKLKQLILESIPAGLITIDLDGQITTFNRAAQEITGYHPFEVEGQSLQKFLPLQTLQTVVQDGISQNETVATNDHRGQEIVLDTTLLPLRDDRGKQVGVLLTFTNVTTMHRLEEEKRRLDRLASLGQMAANVAHEVRNPLAAIKTSMQMLLDDLSHIDQGAQVVLAEVQESIPVVLQEVERLDAIVHDLLLFSRPRQLHRVECNILELIERVVQVIHPQCQQAGIVIHRVFHEVPAVQVDVAQMEQSLLNLILNAIHAMPDGGLLTVSCQVVSAASTLSFMAGVPVIPRDEQKSYLEISISDTGTGIAPGELERIFQPFFTTKAHGIGLGLPITRRLIEDHGGSIQVQSQHGYGATFIVRLPLL